MKFCVPIFHHLTIICSFERVQVLNRVCRQTKFKFGQWYSLAQDHSDTKNQEEVSKFSKKNIGASN